MQLNIKFPAGMSRRDKDIILRQLYKHFEKRPLTTIQEGYLRIRAFVEEHFCIGTGHHRPGAHQK